MSKDKLQIVEITWDDATIFNNELTKEDCEKLTMARYRTVGYIVYKQPDVICIAGDYFPEYKRYRQINLIPTQSIVSIKRLIVSRSKKDV